MSHSTPFYYFLTSVTLSALATVFIRFGVAWHILQQTQSPSLVAIVIGSSALLEIYSKPLLAPLADYFNRLRLFWLCVLLSTLFGLLLSLTAWVLPDAVALLAVLLGVLSLVAALRDPTSAAISPSLAPPGKLTETQSMRSTANAVVAIVGPMAAGVSVTGLGTATTLVISAGLTALSFLLALRIQAVTPAAAAAAPSWATYRKTWHLRTLQGLRSVLQNRTERNFAFSAALLNIGLFSFATVVLPVWVSTTLRGTAINMAVMELGFGLGLLLGSVLLARVLNERLGRYAALVLATVLIGSAYLVMALLTATWLISICMALAGAGISVFFINTTTLRAAATPPQYRARTMAGVSFLACCMYPLVTPAFGYLMEHFDARSSVALCGVFVLLAALVLLFNQDARKLLSQPNENIMGHYKQLYPKAFADDVEYSKS